MKVLLIEDEFPAAKRLRKLIEQTCPDAEVIEVIDSVEMAVKWLREFETPDLIFMDIQLADGLSFDIFTQVDVESPVVFTTAYDQYTLKAFKVNSVDYLLKPIDVKELEAAVHKYKTLYQSNMEFDSSVLAQLVANISENKYKERFLVKIGQQLTYVSVEDIAYFYSDDGMLYVQTVQHKRHVLDYTLDQLEKMIDSKFFFRINRKIITHLKAIKKIHTYFNSRLKLELDPAIDLDVIVSRDRVGDFKEWLDR